MGLNEVDIRRVLWTFAQAFLGSFLAFASGFLAAPEWSNVKSLAVAAVIAGIAAGISAVKNLFLSDGSTLK
jgi:hypothetical protein